MDQDTAQNDVQRTRTTTKSEEAEEGLLTIPTDHADDAARERGGKEDADKIRKRKSRMNTKNNINVKQKHIRNDMMDNSNNQKRKSN